MRSTTIRRPMPMRSPMPAAAGAWRRRTLRPQKLAEMLQTAFAAPGDLAKRAAAAHAAGKARRRRASRRSGRPDRRRMMGGAASHPRSLRHRHDPFHRHRRHRHERHRRDHAQSRLSSVHGLRCGRQRQREASARAGHSRRRRPFAGQSRATRSSSSIPRPSKPAMPNSMRRAPGNCRWCAAPRCWPRSCG